MRTILISVSVVALAALLSVWAWNYGAVSNPTAEAPEKPGQNQVHEEVYSARALRMPDQDTTRVISNASERVGEVSALSHLELEVRYRDGSLAGNRRIGISIDAPTAAQGVTGEAEQAFSTEDTVWSSTNKNGIATIVPDEPFSLAEHSWPTIHVPGFHLADGPDIKQDGGLLRILVRLAESPLHIFAFSSDGAPLPRCAVYATAPEAGVPSDGKAIALQATTQANGHATFYIDRECRISIRATSYDTRLHSQTVDVDFSPYDASAALTLYLREASQGACIAVRIIDSSTEEQLTGAVTVQMLDNPGAKLKLVNVDHTTQAQPLCDLPPGLYQIAVERDYRDPLSMYLPGAEATVEFSGTEDVQVDLRVAPAGRLRFTVDSQRLDGTEITGIIRRVEDSSAGNNIIFLEPSPTGSIPWKSIRREGVYFSQALTPGRYRVLLFDNGDGAIADTFVQVEAGQTRDFFE